MTREIVLAVDIASDAESIFDAITSQDGIAGFWTADVTTSGEVGASLRLSAHVTDHPGPRPRSRGRRGPGL